MHRALFERFALQEKAFFPVLVKLSEMKEHLEHDFIHAIFEKIGLQPQEVEALVQQKVHFIFLLDGYDEISVRENLWAIHGFNKWPAKICISCREEVLGDKRAYKDQFEGEQESFQEIHIQNFSTDQIKTYLETYTAVMRTEWPYQRYVEEIEKLPELKSLIQTPFILRIVVKVLPSIIAKHAKQGQNSSVQLTRLNIYENFTEQWFKQGKERVKKAGLLRFFPDGAESAFEDYSKQLALKMRALDKYIVDYKPSRKDLAGGGAAGQNPWQPFFDETPELSAIRSGMLLQRVGPYSWKFLHKSLVEYFVMRFQSDEIAAIPGTPSPTSLPSAPIIEIDLNKRLLTSGMLLRSQLSNPTHFEQLIRYKVISASGTLQDDWAKYLPSELMHLKELLNSVETGEIELLYFHRDRVKQDKAYAERLKSIVHASKTNPHVAVAAANAITILNLAGELFYGEDLSGIRIPGANLQGIVLDRVTLRGADLSGVYFRQAWLQGADFRDCEMQDVNFGERPFIYFGAVVNACCLSADGKWVLVGGAKCSLKLFEFASGRELKSFVGHANIVRSVAFSSDGKFALSGSDDNTVKVWEIASGMELKSLSGHKDDVNSVAFSPDGKFALSGSDDKTVKLWELASGKEIKSLAGPTVTSVAFSPDGKFALSGSYDDTVKVWDLATEREIKKLIGHAHTVTSVAFSPDGKFALSGSYDNTVKVWELASGRKLKSLSGHTDIVTSVAFSPDGKFALSGNDDKTVKVWELASGRELKSLNGHTGPVNSVVFSPDGKFALSGSEDRTVKVWELPTRKELKSLVGHTEVTSVALSPDGKFALSGSLDRTVKVWEISTGRELKSLTGHTDAVLSVAFSPDGKFALSGSTDKTVKVWEIATGRKLKSLTGHTDAVLSVAFSPDGKFALSRSKDRVWKADEDFESDDQIVKVWELASWRELKSLTGHTDAVLSVAFSPDGKFALLGGFNTLKVWKLASRREPMSFDGYVGVVRSVALSPDGKFALSGSDDETVELWELSSRRELKSLNGHTGPVNSVAFSPDGKFALSGSTDKTVKVWELASGRELFTLTGFTHEVNTCTWQGNHIIAGSLDLSIKAWRLIPSDTPSAPFSAQLMWSSKHPLHCLDLNVEGARHLSDQNARLLTQHGALL